MLYNTASTCTVKGQRSRSYSIPRKCIRFCWTSGVVSVFSHKQSNVTSSQTMNTIVKFHQPLWPQIFLFYVVFLLHDNNTNLVKLFWAHRMSLPLCMTIIWVQFTTTKIQSTQSVSQVNKRNKQTQQSFFVGPSQPPAHCGWQHWFACVP